ncbi:MAG: LamG domain-containing protein [Candidatus Microsaccharimonas sp.]
MIGRRFQQGFTAIELLITLFVAAAFLIAGYQLFSVVIRDGGDTRAESKAANVAYDYMRQYSTSAANPCVNSQPLTASAITVTGLANPKISIVISCPQDDAPTINKIEAYITYGPTNDKTVKYATFVDTSKGAAPTNNITSGMIGWWKFNGNATDSSGAGLTGTVTAATLTIGQNAASNTAYAFNGSSAYVTIPTSMARPTTALTVSAWVKTADVQSATQQKIMSTIQTGGYTLALSDLSCPNQIGFVIYIGGAYRTACATIDTALNSTWIFLTGVYDGSSVRFYLNGALAASTGVSGSFTYGAAGVPLCIGADPGATTCSDAQYFAGSIDDVRAYNRALTPTEVQLIYTGGGQ